MQVVHCDLAARNILISEGFLLKIGDFGMSKKTTEEENYHNITDVNLLLCYYTDNGTLAANSWMVS